MANINRQRSACSPTNKYLSFNASTNKRNNSTVELNSPRDDDDGVLVGRATSSLAASSATNTVGNNGVYVGAMVKPLEFQSTHRIILHVLGLPVSAVQQLTLRQVRVAIYFGLLIVSAFLYETVVVGDLTYLCHHLSTALFLPLFAIACGYYWLAIAYRNTWSSTSIYLLFCGCYVGEVIGQCCFVNQQELSAAELEENQKIEEQVNRAVYNGMPIIIQSRGFSGLYLLLTQAPLLLTISAAGYFSSLRTVRENVVVGGLVFVSRILAVTQLTSLPRSIRPFVSYTCGLVGIVMAKYMEAVFNYSVERQLTGSNGNSSGNQQSSNSSTATAMSAINSSHVLLPSPDNTVGGRMSSAGRRRRASSSANLQVHGPKGRRTSLPAISLQKNPQHQGGMSSLDMALLSEAHGLITDMLADTSLPSHVVSGLRALSNLLSPPASNHIQSHSQRLRFAALNNDFNLGSGGATVADGEEIPIMGETLSALPKKFRRSFQASLLRRMSTSTWTTTTSATGMPTLEPEPCRKRSTSFRNPPDLITSSSPTSQLLAVQDHYCLHERTPVSKYRSYSTTSLMVNPSPNRRLSRERKTVCSLHPLTINDINRLHFLSDAAIAASGDGGGSSGGEDNDDDRRSFGAGDLSDGGCDAAPTSHGSSYDCLGLTLGNGGGASSGETSPCLSPRVSQGIGTGSGSIVISSSSLNAAAIPSIRRVINPPPTCSECENNESSSNSENNSLALPLGDSTAIKFSEVRDPDVCFTVGQSPDVSPSIEQADLDCLADLGSGRVIYVEDGTRYDLERLAEDHYLERINEWDYPIFELEQLNHNSVLSKMCYRVFLEAGLFETFRIPIQEFLAYFHALECGYREKPYHNRMHAADVLHAVFYLTTQPIPGFAHLPLEESPPPVQKSDTGTCSPGLVQRQSFNAEDTYGIMGANLPALELMALYTAAAMHDYEHPGRTNAFLVTTYAPQAILYNDRSVLENHHAAAAWSLFLSKPDYNFLCHLDKAEFKRFRFLVIEAILATDLKRHFEILAEFNAKATDDDAPGIDWNLEADRLLAMEMCIKLADINGPCKKHDIHVQWTKRIADEFYEQGDEEASLGLQISPFMDRLNPQLAKLQDSFINHLVAPLCTSYGEAGFLPGQWVQGSESEDETGNDELDDKQNGENDTRQKKLLKRSKIVSLQAQHLKENHDHWAIKVREEEEEVEQHQDETES